MSTPPLPVDPVAAELLRQRQAAALRRLDTYRRGLQRYLKRKPTSYERALLDRAALMQLRAEIATNDPKSSTNDVVRLVNASRRACNDFMVIAKPKAKPQRSMAELEAELVAAHG